MKASSRIPHLARLRERSASECSPGEGAAHRTLTLTRRFAPASPAGGRGEGAACYFATTLASLLISFALLWGWIALAPMAYLDPEYPAWRAKQMLLARCDLGDLLILGDSRAAVDIMPALLPARATNLAVGGGSPIEAYFMLDRALACPSAPKRIILSLDAPHFTELDLIWERSARFGLLGASELADIQATAARLRDDSIATLRSGGLPFRARSALYAMRFPSIYFNSLMKGGIALRWWQNHAMLTRTLAARGQYFFGIDPGCSLPAAEARLIRFAPLPVLDAYFGRLLALAATHGVTVEFVAMPLNHSTWEKVAADTRDAFAAYLDAQAARHANLRIVGEVMPHWPDRWFGDAFAHLNPEGAQLFSRNFAEWLASPAAGSPAEHAERSAMRVVE